MAAAHPMKTSTRLRARLKLLRLSLLRFEFRIAPTEQQRLFILTLLIGVVCGFTAVGFHFAIAFFEQQLISRAMAARGPQWVVWTIVSPALGFHGLTDGHPEVFFQQLGMLVVTAMDAVAIGLLLSTVVASSS